MKPIRVSAPAASPVDLAELKHHARVDFTDDDVILQAYLDAAVDHLDGWTGILGRAMINQDWRIDVMTWPACGIVLPFGDVSDATITYYDAANNQQTLPSSQYEVVQTATGSIIRFNDTFERPALNLNRADVVQVTFTTGFGPDASAVPPALKVAIMLLASHWYEHREGAEDVDVRSVPLAVDRLITPYRRVFF